MTCTEISYDLIFLIVNLYNLPVRIPINTFGLVEVFISLDSIISNQNLVSISKSWSSGTTFKLDYGYHLRASYKYINSHPDKYGKSLFAGPYEILCINLAIIVMFFTYCCWTITTRKMQVYKNVTKCMRNIKCIKKYKIDGRYSS